mgnify:CR=1 FL=1
MKQWEIEYKIPIKISKLKPIGGFGAPLIFRFIFSAFKKSLVFGVMILLVASQTSFFSAFEAHIINVTASICDYSEIRSMGYWKNHPALYTHYLPQSLGDEIIDTFQKADDIFYADNSVMRNKLKKQLLAMKFNIAYFQIGDYYVESEGKTLSQIAAEADDLLRQDPPPSDSVLEEIKNILDYLNNLGQIRFCRIPPLYSEHLVINKVYYDVDAGHGKEYANEWVELYNPTEEAVNISGWKIIDNILEDTIPDSSVIPPGGFAIITASSTTFNFWFIPSGVVKIILNDGKIGNGLNNDADMLILKDEDGGIVDQMNWGAPDNLWPNYNSGVWNPGATDAPEGHALTRIPAGFDTDQSSDFHDITPPDVELIYPHGGESWSTNQKVILRWSATNFNGPANDLLIDIYYITDNDYSTAISSGDSIYHIADDAENDGEFKWRVNPGFWGFVWIKIVATGPENFIASDFDLSGPVREPPEDTTGMKLPPYPPEILAMFGIEQVGSQQDEEGAAIDSGNATSSENLTDVSEDSAGGSEDLTSTMDNVDENIEEIVLLDLENGMGNNSATTTATTTDSIEETIVFEIATTSDEIAIITDTTETSASEGILIETEAMAPIKVGSSETSATEEILPNQETAITETDSLIVEEATENETPGPDDNHPAPDNSDDFASQDSSGSY